MGSQTVPFITPEEYLAAERNAEFKSEFCEGQIYAMAGASPVHGVIVANLSGELRAALRGRPCQVFTNDARVFVNSSFYAYPDVAVICGQPKYSDLKRDTFVNPQVLMEVLSPSTEAYDRGIKFAQYRSLASLQEYLLVSQHSHLVEQFIRRDHSGWHFQATEGLASRVRLPSLDVELALGEIYYNVDFVK